MTQSKYAEQLTTMILTLLMLCGIVGAQDTAKQDATVGKPVLWEKVDVSQQDLLNGPGGQEMRPDTTSVKFVKDQTGGHSTKYVITDGSGKKWIAKIGSEAQSETAAVRLVWALGYKSEVNYLVPKLTIPGKGDFTNVRLEARPETDKRGDYWSWRDNPFKGTREFQALKIMMAFLNNWDMKEANNVIITRGDRSEYVISDLGVSFGKTGSNGLPLFWRIGRSRNEPEHYTEADFIKNIKDGKIAFSFNGKNDGQLGDITSEDGRWLANLLLQLTDKQIEDAFTAANYTKDEIATLTASVKGRIRALDLATQGADAKNVDAIN